MTDTLNHAPIPDDEPGEHSNLRELLRDFESGVTSEIPSIGVATQMHAASLSRQIGMLQSRLAALGLSGLKDVARLSNAINQLESRLAASEMSNQQKTAGLVQDQDRIHVEISESISSYQAGFARLTKDLEENAAQTAIAIEASQSGLARAARDLGELVSCDFILALLAGDVDEDIEASELNVAEADTFKRSFVVDLRNSRGATWSGAQIAEPIVTSAEQIADEHVAAPVVESSVMAGEDPWFLNGRCAVVATFDTDEGVTKTYVAGDKCTVTFQVAATDTWHGGGVVPFVKTFTVV